MYKTLTTLAIGLFLAIGLQLSFAEPSEARRGGSCKDCDWVAQIQFCRADNSIDGWRICRAGSDNSCEVSGWCRISEPI